MRKTCHLTIYFFWLMVAACGTSDFTTKEQESKYFDIEGLVREQLKILPAASLYLSKTASVGKDTTRTVIMPDSTQWLLEFQNLTDADINKPRLTDSYITEITRPGDTVTVTKYLSLHPDKTHIDTLVITERPGEIIIEAKIRKKNVLFSSEKSLNYHLIKQNGDFILSTYHVRGWQKMIALDSVRYSIYAEVLR